MNKDGRDAYCAILIDRTVTTFPSSKPTTSARCPASGSTSAGFPSSTYTLSPATSVYLAPLLTHSRVHWAAFRSAIMCFALQDESLTTPLRTFCRPAVSSLASTEAGCSRVVTARAVVAETIASMIADAHATAAQSPIKLSQKRGCFILASRISRLSPAVTHVGCQLAIHQAASKLLFRYDLEQCYWERKSPI